MTSTDTNPHAAYYAAKSRVMTALESIGATSPESSATDADLIAAGGESLLAAASYVAARGAEVKYSYNLGAYWLGRVRNNGRA